MTHNDFLFRGGVDELDPEVAELIRHETARQQEKLILIPSESTVPFAVRNAISSPFHNLYAEGYPLENSRKMTESQILDYEKRLPEFRRQSDQRYYKGTEYANILESLARRRAAELFAGNGLRAEDLFVNVQPLSGAPANNAVYSALLNVGDTVMGMDLIMGGHLTHGSPVNRSGINYNIVSYSIDHKTERLDYDQIRDLAREHKPRLIIGGFSSYPYAADWTAFRSIADEVGAFLLADVAHVAGLIAAGLYPNPVGIADVVSFTTHKTLNGPRGAVLITHRKDLSRKLDRAVFPGEQGGPHINTMAGLAVALRIAGSGQFRDLQRETLANAVRLGKNLQARGLRLPYGGTDTHLLLLDCKTIVGDDGTKLSGDMAARILDLAGIVVNRQTIPGDTSALRPSGIRLGATWVTQRGMGSSEIDELGDIIADVLQACRPFSLTGRLRPLPRAKIDFDLLRTAAARSRVLALRIGIDTNAQADGYPHFFTGAAEPSSPADAAPVGAQHQLPPKSPPTASEEAVGATYQVARHAQGSGGRHTMSPLQQHKEGGGVETPAGGGHNIPPLEVSVAGAAAGDFLHVATTSDVAALHDGESQPTHILERDGMVMASGEITRLTASEYRLNIAGAADRAVSWLRALSDGFVLSDDQDVHAKLPGPVAVTVIGEGEPIALAPTAGYGAKAYHIGINGENFAVPTPGAQALPKFVHEIAATDKRLQTPLHSLHLELGAKMAPFADYDMPLWYKSVSEEHAAVREDAGIFDVAHMGVFDLRGRGAIAFLDLVTTNDVRRLKVGHSHYTYLLDVDGIPLDDLMIYRLAEDHFLAVVNASNNDKNWAWLNAVIAGEVMIDRRDPSRRILPPSTPSPGPFPSELGKGSSKSPPSSLGGDLGGGWDFHLRDLRQQQWREERRVDIALQGPRSRDYLLALGGTDEDLAAVRRLKWAGVARAHLGGFDLIVSRTGYTGERVAYELFVHPKWASQLFRRLVDMGVTPCGLAARDSLRTEAGLPLYGLELAGDLNLNPAEAGFGAYVKLYKPFFIGKRAFIEHEAKRKTQVSRFRLDSKGADGSVSTGLSPGAPARPRPAHYGDPIVNARGRVVGTVTSCNIDTDGNQLGQALMERGFRKPGTKLAVFAGAGRAKSTIYAELAIGARATVPQPLTILTRFPRRK